MTLPTKLDLDLKLYPLDEDVVAFSERAQCLFGLNPTAAFIVRSLQEGNSTSDLVEGLTAEGALEAADAEHWVKTTIDALYAHGLIESDAEEKEKQATSPAESENRPAIGDTMPPYAPVNSGIARFYRLLDTTIKVQFSSTSQIPWVDAAIGHLQVGDAGEEKVRVDIAEKTAAEGVSLSYIYRDGEPAAVAKGPNYIAPIVKAILWHAAVTAHEFFFNLHAGVVEIDEECILLPAAAGSGKSSLTAALVAHGYRYFSDEVALIEPRTFRVRPVPLALCSKSTGWNVVARYYPEISSLPTHERGDGKQVRYLSTPALSTSGIKKNVEVSHIIFPRYQAHSHSALSSVPRIEAIRRMMEECLALRQRLDQDNVAGLVDWVSHIDCYDLTFSSLEEAVALINRLRERNRLSEEGSTEMSRGAGGE